MHTLKIRKFGDSAGVTLPRELLERLNLQVGERLHLIPRDEGYELRAYDPDLEETLARDRARGARRR